MRARDLGENDVLRKQSWVACMHLNCLLFSLQIDIEMKRICQNINSISLNILVITVFSMEVLLKLLDHVKRTAHTEREK